MRPFPLDVIAAAARLVAADPAATVDRADLKILVADGALDVFDGIGGARTWVVSIRGEDLVRAISGATRRAPVKRKEFEI